MDNERYIKFSKIASFRPNSISYMLTLLSVVFEMAYTVMILDVIESNTKVFGVVMVNIVMLFGLFYLAIKEKNYSSKAGIISLFLALYILIRTFTIIPNYLMPTDRVNLISTMNLIAAILIIISSIKAINISNRREKYKENVEEK